MTNTLHSTSVRFTDQQKPCKGTMVCDCPLCRLEIAQRQALGVRIMPQPWRPKRDKRKAA